MSGRYCALMQATLIRWRPVSDSPGPAALAFVVARPGTNLGENALAKSLVVAVGKGMMPSRINVVECLPKTKNGKILRRAIRARYPGEPIGDMSSLDPATPLESIPPRD